MSEFRSGEIEGVVVRKLTRFVDSRGWLAEVFRADELPADFSPAMAYVSITEPGFIRGPHEHIDQADFFCFPGTSSFKLRLWDNRRDSPTYEVVTTLILGQDNPCSILIPKGVVHAYQNTGASSGIVINCPNRLYMGHHRTERVDEIRHEDDPDTVFRMND